MSGAQISAANAFLRGSARTIARCGRIGGAGLSVVAAFAWILAAIPTDARAQWTAPTGTRGWCTYVSGPTDVCVGDPQSACRAQLDTRPNTLGPYEDTKYWWSKRCTWSWILGTSLPTTTHFECATGYKRVAPGRCVDASEDFEARDCLCDINGGGTPFPWIPKPIGILDGAKAFTERDFATANGALAVDRYYSSQPAGASANTLIALPLGFANWRFGLGMELHLADDWSTGVAGLATPHGGHYRFTKSGVAMVATNSTAYPTKQTDYTLEFVGTWPSAIADVLKAKSAWIVRDADDRTWYLESRFDPSTGLFDIARPTRVVEPDGLEQALQYTADGALESVTTSFGATMTFEWISVGDRPRVISKITLPDGTTLEYAYEALSANLGAPPERLVSVERRQGATVLDKTTYDYGDNRFQTFVTGVRDRDGTLRRSVIYDGLGRATSSAGPGGAESYAVDYGAPGATFTRTVTTPLAKPVTYTFTRTSTNLNIKLTGVTTAASTNSPATSEAKTFDSNLYIATETDAEGRVTGYTRDARGRPTVRVEAQGTALARSSTVTWHSARNVATQTVEPGLTTSTPYASGTSAGGPPGPVYVASQTFAFTGASQAYIVPAGASLATVQLWGGAGGNGNTSAGARSGAGGYVEATFTVAPGDSLTFEVAGGGQGAMRNTAGGAGGWPDGGSGAYGNNGSGGGGGSTRFYINGVLKAVAGGGGGSGGYDANGSAGAGGGAVGQSAQLDGGTGGSQTAGGVDSNAPTVTNKSGRSLIAFPGAQRTGGWGASNGTNATSTTDDGGGGGGGYWGGGGGGGDAGSGGGGSSWTDPGATAVTSRGGYRSEPYKTPPGQPTVATGVNSALNGPAVAGGAGYAIVGVR